MEEALICFLAMALCFYSGEAFPSNAPASAGSVNRFTESPFQEDMAVQRNSWDRTPQVARIRAGSTFIDPNVERVSKIEFAKDIPDVFRPISQESGTFLSSSNSMQRDDSLHINSVKGVREESSLLNLQGEGTQSHIKRKRKSMAVINSKKFKFASHSNAPKRRHSDTKVIPKTPKEATRLDDLAILDPATYPTIRQDAAFRRGFEDVFKNTQKAVSQLTLPERRSLIGPTHRPPSSHSIDLPSTTTTPFNITTGFIDHPEVALLTNTGIPPTKVSVNHVDLQSLERELAQTKEKTNRDLLLAISILQHHIDPKSVSSDRQANEERGQILEKSNSPSYLQSSEDSDEITNYRLSHNQNNIFKIDSPTASTFTFNVEINDAFSPSHDLSEELNERLIETIPSIPSSPSHAPTIAHLRHQDMPQETYKKEFRWFVLVMDGNCTIIRHRMSSFVTFLKAALSAKLEARYEDIYVPSVFCHKNFMVNISIDSAKYPEAEHKLDALAKANTTLLELSGEIFYLEKVMYGRAFKRVDTASYLVRSDDIQVVIYFAVGCMCVFILLSVVIVSLIKVCRQDDAAVSLEKDGSPMKQEALPTRKPNVIYSRNFTQSLNPDKYRLDHEESATTTACMGLPFDGGENSGVVSTAPSSSSRHIDAYIHHGGEKNQKELYDCDTPGERKTFGFPPPVSKLCLLEELREEEEDIEEDEYREENNDLDVDEEDDDYEDDEENEEKEDEEEYVDDHQGDQERIIKNDKRESVNAFREGSRYDSTRSPSLYRGIRSLCLPTPGHDVVTPSQDVQTSFENPCYER